MLFTAIRWVSTKAQALSVLRKKTGYSVQHCKRAIDQFGDNLDEAEKWLHQSAQKEGWQRASGLEGRKAHQGLVVLQRNADAAALVEVNCETDFVARSEPFHRLVDGVCEAVLHQIPPDPAPRPEAILNFRLSAGESVSALLDRSRTLLREKLVIANAVRWNGHVGAYVHGEKDRGRFGALVQVDGPCPDHVAKQLAQQVVGMRPLRIDGTRSQDPEKEECLLHQEWMVDPTKTVGQIVTEQGVRVRQFVRLECGQPMSLTTE